LTYPERDERLFFSFYHRISGMSGSGWKPNGGFEVAKAKADIGLPPFPEKVLNGEVRAR
jgi:hypothetical protein